MRRLAACALVLAAGCSGSSGPRPRALSPAPSPPVSSPSSSPAGTVEQQVLAAVRAYYAEVDRAGNTGDVARLEALSVPDCDCRKLAKGIAQTYASGTRIVGAVHTLVDPRLTRLAPPAAFVAARLRVSAHALVQANGSRRVQPADEFPINVVLARKTGKWLIIAVRGVE